MQISAVSSAANTVAGVETGNEAPTMIQKVRSLKMKTRVTPGLEDEPIQEAAPVEAPKEETQAATEEHQPLSPQLAAIAKAKRALQAKERELADREKAMAERAATQASGIDLAQLKSDPLGVLLENGVTYDQLTEAVLANQVDPKVRELEKKLKALEEGMEKKLTDREVLAEQQALAEMRKEASHLTAEGEEFELVRETGSIPVVMKLIEKTYRESGEVLDVREALQLVEAELINDSLKLAKLKKVQGQIAPQPAPQPSQQQRQMRTLTNRDTASIPMSRKARALAAFNGTLKK